MNAEWKQGLPEPGHYWAWCKYDADMMDVFVTRQGDITIIRNNAEAVIGVIGRPPGITIEEFERVFSHFTPYKNRRSPIPPRQQ